ncbi:hypothetical protein K8T06_05145 [bacterium]|nr:hypothetical protein [bacterium]
MSGRLKTVFAVLNWVYLNKEYYVNRFYLILVLSMFMIFMVLNVNAFVDDGSLSWQDKSLGMLDLNLKSVAVDSSGVRILAASDETLYLSVDNGNSWNIVFNLNSRVLKSDDPEPSYPVTKKTEEHEFDRSDYDSDDLQRDGILEEDEDLDDIDDDDLRKRLEDAGLLEEERDIVVEEQVELRQEDLLIAGGIIQVVWDPVNVDIAYFGTDQGVYVSRDSGLSWSIVDISSLNRGLKVKAIAVLPPDGDLVVVSDEGLFLSIDNAQSFNSVGSTEKYSGLVDIESDLSGKKMLITADSSGVYVFSRDLKHLFKVASGVVGIDSIQSVAIYDDENIYAASRDHLYFLNETGGWSLIPGISFAGTEIRDIAVSSRWLVAATSRGVFVWNRSSNKGRFFNNGLTEHSIWDIGFNPKNPEQIWIATASGIYVLEKSTGLKRGQKSIVGLPMGFPSLASLIQSAVIFAEVDIKRESAQIHRTRNRGFFPWISIILDNSDKNVDGYAMSDVIASCSGRFYIGPMDEIYGSDDKKTLDFSLSMRWEPNLSIFDNDELKVRERFGKEINRRNKIINHINLIYDALANEYLRKNTSYNMQKLITTELKIQQFQAELDALTGFVYNFANIGL